MASPLSFHRMNIERTSSESSPKTSPRAGGSEASLPSTRGVVGSAVPAASKIKRFKEFLYSIGKGSSSFVKPSGTRSISVLSQGSEQSRSVEVIATHPSAKERMGALEGEIKRLEMERDLEHTEAHSAVDMKTNKRLEKLFEKDSELKRIKKERATLVKELNKAQEKGNDTYADRLLDHIAMKQADLVKRSGLLRAEQNEAAILEKQKLTDDLHVKYEGPISQLKELICEIKKDQQNFIAERRRILLEETTREVPRVSNGYTPETEAVSLSGEEVALIEKIQDDHKDADFKTLYATQQRLAQEAGVSSSPELHLTFKAVTEILLSKFRTQLQQKNIEERETKIKDALMEVKKENALLLSERAAFEKRIASAESARDVALAEKTAALSQVKKLQAKVDGSSFEIVGLKGENDLKDALIQSQSELSALNRAMQQTTTGSQTEPSVAQVPLSGKKPEEATIPGVTQREMEAVIQGSREFLRGLTNGEVMALTGSLPPVLPNRNPLEFSEPTVVATADAKQSRIVTALQYAPMVAVLAFMGYQAHKAGLSDETKAMFGKAKGVFTKEQMQALIVRAKEIFTKEQMSIFASIVQDHAKKRVLDMNQLSRDLFSNVKPTLEQSRDFIVSAGAPLVASASQFLANLKPEDGFGERLMMRAGSAAQSALNSAQVAKQATETSIGNVFDGAKIVTQSSTQVVAEKFASDFRDLKEGRVALLQGQDPVFVVKGVAGTVLLPISMIGLLYKIATNKRKEVQSTKPANTTSESNWKQIYKEFVERSE